MESITLKIARIHAVYKEILHIYAHMKTIAACLLPVALFTSGCASSNHASLDQATADMIAERIQDYHRNNEQQQIALGMKNGAVEQVIEETYTEPVESRWKFDIENYAPMYQTTVDTFDNVPNIYKLRRRKEWAKDFPPVVNEFIDFIRDFNEFGDDRFGRIRVNASSSRIRINYSRRF